MSNIDPSIKYLNDFEYIGNYPTQIQYAPNVAIFHRWGSKPEQLKGALPRFNDVPCRDRPSEEYLAEAVRRKH